MRRLRVCCQIDIDHAEDHPLAVGRNFRFPHALELHHVFEGERVFDLGETGKREDHHGKKTRNYTAHENLLGKPKSLAGFEGG